ncbi:hypothetical protein LF599_04325 [Pseudodesulfovibrio thermohalotolerans]|uniref:DNA modification system-associated small protein n=1 Tax=Pseudodesulfovibrio thermohalotolerans TaxID=2880651 RepID=UPI002441CF33|nr:DNA modification system-associated small protein [Pseudodesulfovibrio thermohalotolerans]WFS63396.1 hypothetical protein LF599_04325 [Pseudodesulfovibrio thermohalotolerans]
MSSRRELPLLKDKKAKRIFEELCQQHGVTVELIEGLIDIQRDNLGRGRQIGITQEFSALFSEFIDEMKGAENVSN